MLNDLVDLLRAFKEPAIDDNRLRSALDGRPVAVEELEDAGEASFARINPRVDVFLNLLRDASALILSGF